MATTEFAFNNKVHISIKLSPFEVNYEKEPRMGFEIRKKKKYMKTEEFVEEIKEIHEEVKMVLIKLQEKMKKYIDKKEAVEYKMGNKMLLSTKNLT